jgi:hypothetical protein
MPDLHPGLSLPEGEQPHTTLIVQADAIGSICAQRGPSTGRIRSSPNDLPALDSRTLLRTMSRLWMRWRGGLPQPFGDHRN